MHLVLMVCDWIKVYDLSWVLFLNNLTTGCSQLIQLISMFFAVFFLSHQIYRTTLKTKNTIFYQR